MTDLLIETRLSAETVYYRLRPRVAEQRVVQLTFDNRPLTGVGTTIRLSIRIHYRCLNVILAAVALAACYKRERAATVPVGHSVVSSESAPGTAPASRARSRSDTTELVVAESPTVIGFFPPPQDSADAEDDGYREGVAHITFALEDAAACLGRDSSQVVLVVDTAVRVRRSRRIDTLRFSRVDSLSYGVYFIAPGRDPHMVPHSIGPSTLSPAVRTTIPGYFGRTSCPDSL